MKILAVADIHYSLPQFDWIEQTAGDFDVVIIAGDLLDLAGFADLDVQIVVVHKYLERLRKKTKLFVSSGNHDGDTRNDADEMVTQWLQDARNENLFVDGDGVNLKGTRFTVLPWWDGPETREQMVSILDAEVGMTRSKWLLIHHAPPSESPISLVRDSDQGDPFFRGILQRLNPDLAICGHIHNSPFAEKGSWVDKVGSTWVFNPGKQIGPVPSHVLFDLEAMTAEWVSVYGSECVDLNETQVRIQSG